MEQIRTKVRKWGNSFGIILPKDLMNSKRIEEGSEISVMIQPENKMTVGDVMDLSRKLGLAKKLKGINTQKVLDDVDKELWPEEE